MASVGGGGSSWVADFNSLQNSQVITNSKGSRGPVKKPQGTAEKLKAELKLLEWHKLANDAAIKAALMQSKNLKQESPQRESSHIADDAHWIRRVINNEQTKPLEVSREYVLQYQKKEKESSERLAHQVEHHIDTLKSLRTRLEDRQELRSRTAEFREWKKEFVNKKFAVFSGKTLDEFNRESKSGPNPAASIMSGLNNSNSLALSGPAAEKSKVNRASELSAVLLSLEKLNELEKRITSLEGDNAYDRMMEAEGNTEARNIEKERLALEFKHKVKGDGVVNRQVFAVRERKTAWEKPKILKNGRVVAAGGGVNAAKANRSGRGTGHGGGTFLTDVGDEDVGVDRSRQRAERLREQHIAPAGKKSLRVRVQNKKARLKESELSKQRHNEALEELKKRQVNKGGKKPQQLPTIARKGASSGVKSNNKYMQDFQKMKQGYVKKREDHLYSSNGKSKEVPTTRKSKTVPTRVSGHSAVGGKTGIGNLAPLGAVGNGVHAARAVNQTKW